MDVLSSHKRRVGFQRITFPVIIADIVEVKRMAFSEHLQKSISLRSVVPEGLLPPHWEQLTPRH